MGSKRSMYLSNCRSELPRIQTKIDYSDNYQPKDVKGDCFSPVILDLSKFDANAKLKLTLEICVRIKIGTSNGNFIMQMDPIDLKYVFKYSYPLLKKLTLFSKTPDFSA